MILNKLGKIANEIWLDLDKHFENILIDEFVVMPNHVHGIIMIVDEINSFAEEAIPFRFECPVVDGLRFFHLPVGPVPDLTRRSERNSNRIETYRFLGFGKKAKQFFHISTYLLK